MTPQEIITEAKRKVCIKHNKPEYFAYQVQDEITLEAVKIALSIDSVSVSSLKVCTGCGTGSNEPIGVNKKTGEPYLSCCPDNNYIPLADFLKHSIYSR